MNKSKHTHPDDRLKLTIPADSIETVAWAQIEAALTMPELKKLAIMPDVHAGYDLPIGGVALLDGHVWPGAVGYDIGCGMSHVNTGKKLDELPPMKEVFERLTNEIPVGFNEHETCHGDIAPFPNASGCKRLEQAVNQKAKVQLGTLGGGNHFCEIGVNPLGDTAITIHSGSRRPGWLIGDYYMRLTGGSIPLDSEVGQNYLHDMKWALSFASRNRFMMMKACLRALHLSDGLPASMIDESHNHAIVTPDGVLHRKGATPAEKNQWSIIPGNMRDGVWITLGCGNEDFLCSASHGAGRAMSRKKATKMLSMETLQKDMEGIVCPDLDGLLDESPDAYKSVTEVLQAQEGLLVNFWGHFEPVLVLKG